MPMRTETLAWGDLTRAVLGMTLTIIVLAAVGRVVTYGTSDIFSRARSGALVGSASQVASPFHYAFSQNGVLEEAGSAQESTSPYWWLDAGGKLLIRDGRGMTLQGALASDDFWRKEYARTASVDTEKGAYPQNIFRLLTRSTWDDVSIENSFRIRADHFTKSDSRNESNGILLMSRYANENNLYYAGLRVDGDAVIKKKYRGTYYTLAETNVYPGTYSNGENKNLLPHDTWIDLKLETKTEGDAVRLALYIKRDGVWEQLLSTLDDGSQSSTTLALLREGAVGIRTDFMDVEFDNFRAEKI